ncbi:MAG: hypothetical protein WB565_06745 [Acidimicrobiales bacterium]
MHLKRLLASTLLGACIAIAVAAPPAAEAAPPMHHSATPSSLARASASQLGAGWLAGQLTPGGYLLSATSPGQPDLVATANAVLALASAGLRAPASRALTYLEGHIDQYVVTGGADGPGQLSLLILDAHALGVDPTTFGGTDLVSRLLATERMFGPDAGLFGVQDPTFDGAYRQGLSLAALAAAGVVGAASLGTAAVHDAEAWLTDQQCPNGGWTSFVTVSNPCDGSPASFEGPDTNSTALAVVGLEAQGALSGTAAAAALGFIENAQDGDAGWGFFPNAPGAPGSTDPDSTALVIQAILALGHSPANAPFVVGGSNPYSTLLGFQLTSGSGRGAFTFPGSPGPNILATYQAVPAAAGVTLPFSSTKVTGHLSRGGATSTFSASVSALVGLPVGTVTFSVANVALCTGAVMSGTAVCGAPSPASTAVVTATYTGEPTFGVSSGAASQGYWLVAADGGIFAFGDAPFEGSHGGSPLNAPIVGMAATADGAGYWLVAADGGVFAYGDATFEGSHGGSPLNAPICGMAATPDGHGYWLVAADGGIFAYGDAAFAGSQGGSTLNRPIVGMAPTADGGGYWLVGADGGIFTYGDAAFEGSHGGSPLNRPIVGMAPTADGGGYWLVGADGGIFAYGDAAFEGSHGGAPLNAPICGMAATPDGHGYWLVGADGGIFAYGDATFEGSHGGSPLNMPIVGMAATGNPIS